MTIRLFEVGGSIRDELMGIANPPDRDFCAVSPKGWDALLAWCHQNMSKVFLVTPEFFTVRGHMRCGGKPIDIVMCRKEQGSLDGRHPEHVEPGTLEDDLRRRDFTVNALAREVDPNTLKPIGEIIDLFGGAADIELRQLRCVGDTHDRLTEDGLRVLRAARFAVTKSLSPDIHLLNALSDAAWWRHAVATVSEDRVRQELHKMLVHNTADAIRFLADTCHEEAVHILFNGNIWLKPTVEKKK